MHFIPVIVATVTIVTVIGTTKIVHYKYISFQYKLTIGAEKPGINYKRVHYKRDEVYYNIQKSVFVSPTVYRLSP
jgi:hypothetical protein